MATDPRSWIYGFLDRVPGIIAAPARWIADRIFGIFDDGIEFAKWLKSGFDYLRVKGSWALFYIRAFAAEALTTAQWIVTVRIPSLINNAISTVQKWTTTAINKAINVIKGSISTLDKWVKFAIGAVTNALNKARDWLIGKINAITARLAATVDKWFDRLTSPTKMAEWLIGALVGAFWRYAYGNRDKIARWFVRRTPALTVWLVRELESVLRRIL